MKSEPIITVEQIAERYRDEMRFRARRILMSDSDAEDAVQETLLTVLNAPHILSGIERLGGWLITLVTRRSIDIIRRDSLRKAKESKIDDADMPTDVPDPSALLDRNEAASALSEAISSLPEDLKSAFVLNTLEGMTFEEISKKTNIPVGTLTARKKKAQDRIRAALLKKGALI